MDADEDGILLRIRDAGAQIQGNENIALARHHNFESFRFQQRPELARDVEREIFFAAVTAARAFVVTAMSGIEHDRLHFAHVRDHVRAELRFERFREVDARDQKPAVFFGNRKRQPVAHAVDHDLAAAEAARVHSADCQGGLS